MTLAVRLLWLSNFCFRFSALVFSRAFPNFIPLELSCSRTSRVLGDFSAGIFVLSASDRASFVAPEDPRAASERTPCFRSILFIAFLTVIFVQHPEFFRQTL